MKFELETEAADAPAPAIPAPAQRPAVLVDSANVPRLATSDKPKPRGSGSEPAEVGPSLTGDVTEPAPEIAAPSEPNVVSIDAFRKKP